MQKTPTEMKFHLTEFDEIWVPSVTYKYGTILLKLSACRDIRVEDVQ